MSHCQHWRPR